jgi:hypothetical protein
MAEVISDTALEQRREKDRLRKRAERKRVKEAEQIANASNRQEFWQLNRARLEPATLASLLEREAAVLELARSARDYVEGKLEVLDDEDCEWLAETISRVKQCGWFDEYITWIPFHTPDLKEFFDLVVQRGGPTADYIRYGIFTALPSNVYEAFRAKFMTRRFTVPSYWEQITCVCGIVDTVPTGTGESYVKARVSYLCAKCREAERRSREIARNHRGTVMDAYPFDAWGRRVL